MARRRTKRGDYEVGYGRPPKHTQFKRGQSGNPRGRPKKRPTLADLVIKEGRKKVPVEERGQQKLVTKDEAIAAGLYFRASKGDHRAWAEIRQCHAQRADDDDPGFTDLSEEDEAILRRLSGRRKKEDPEGA